MGSYWAQRLSPAARSSLIRQYWSPTDGIGYSVGRVPMAACDYSFSAYSYNEVNNDFNQTYFQLNAEDYKYKIPTIQEAIQVSGGNLKLFSSPWSAPGWMKNTGSMKGGGYLRGDYNGQYFHSYALYFLRFFQSYAQYNITFWGATLENEPGGVSSLDYFESMFFNASYQRDFVKTHWGPVLRGNSLTKNLKLMILDDNRRNLQSWTDVIYSDPNAYNYIDGAAIHWYDDTGTTTATLTEVQEKYPNKFLFYTECSMAPPTYGSWASADFYVNFIMGILNNWSIGFMDWNIHLDPTGGPGSQNPPIWVSNTTDEFEKQPMFYAKGQLSKFIVPGSVILGLNMEKPNQDLEGIAALTPNGQKVIVLNNRSKTTNYTVTIYNSQRSAWLNADLEARSVSTYIFN
uniref:Glucosylceramidase n=1 Tax=Acrobeloides nanus TaxID=290746 RepID=A0A914C5Y4_9BILA